MKNLIKTIDYNSKSAKKDFVDSLHYSGFSILHNHPINISLINEVYNEWEKFFNSNKKHQYLFNLDTQDGYFPFRSENAKGSNVKDLKEFFHYYQWGIYPKNLNNSTKILYNELLNIGKILLKWLDEMSPLEISKIFSIPLSNMVDKSNAN